MQTVQTKQGPGSPLVRRRGLLTAAVVAAGACAAGAVAAPHVVPLAEQEARALALSELKQLEGVSLDAAIEAAEITRTAVRVIVLPVARLVAFLGGNALDLLLAALDGAHNALSYLHLSTESVDALHGVIASWQDGVTSLPIALAAYANADINSAEAYLRALKKLVDSQK